MNLHVWGHRRIVRAVKERLDREGTVGFREMLGAVPIDLVDVVARDVECSHLMRAGSCEEGGDGGGERMRMLGEEAGSGVGGERGSMGGEGEGWRSDAGLEGEGALGDVAESLEGGTSPAQPAPRKELPLSE